MYLSSHRRNLDEVLTYNHVTLLSIRSRYHVNTSLALCIYRAGNGIYA